MGNGAAQDETAGAGSQTALRRANTRRVLDALMTKGPMPQVELAKATGLSSATVSNIVRSLAAGGTVSTSPVTVSGRRGVLVALEAAPRSRVAVGVDFGRRHVRIIVATAAHEVLAEGVRELPLGHPAEDAIAMAGEFLDEILAQAGRTRADVVACGVGIPGPVDQRTGTVAHGAILPEWVGVPAVERLHAAWGLPVFVDNDANLGALGELTWGSLPEDTTLVFVKIGTGIGAGLVVGGQVHRGRHGISGEIGHTTVQELGRMCRCGNRGCLESVASTHAMLTALGSASEDRWTLARLTAAVEAGDPAALRVVEDAGVALGRVLGAVVNLVAPEAIVLGGPVLPIGHALLDSLRHAVARYTTPVLTRDVTVTLSELGERGEALGGCSLVFASTPASEWDLVGTPATSGHGRPHDTTPGSRSDA